MRKTVLLILVCTTFYQFITAQDVASNIRLNQIGFFPEAPKIAVRQAHRTSLMSPIPTPYVPMLQTR